MGQETSHKETVVVNILSSAYDCCCHLYSLHISVITELCNKVPVLSKLKD